MKTLAPLLLAFFLTLTACSDGNDNASATVAYPNDSKLHLNQIQVVGTHNSYHPYAAPEPMATVVREQFPLYEPGVGDYRHKSLYEQLDRLGVRYIELDVNKDPEGGNFSERPLLATIGEDTATGIPELDLPGLKVFEWPQIDAESTCYLFTECLAEIKQWSDEHPGHVPITIMVEIKDTDFFSTATYIPMTAWQVEDYDTLDAEIRSVFSEQQLITPDDVRGNFATLNEAILTVGWPTLGETRGRVMFTNCNCTGLPLDRQRFDYAIGHENLEGRVIFPNSPPGNPDAAVWYYEEPESKQAQIMALVEMGYFIRTRADAQTREAVANDTSRRDAAFSSGSQYIVTDFPEPSVTASPEYFVQIPGGTPARCNPINAPDWCRPEDIENPAYLTHKGQ
jgi:hypothetical protein